MEREVKALYNLSFLCFRFFLIWAIIGKGMKVENKRMMMVYDDSFIHCCDLHGFYGDIY